MDFQKELKDFIPSRKYFIGIDSDGCVFDSMEIKQKKYFIPNALKHFDLYSISEALQKTWEFVNLNSIYRGGNRFISIIKVFELLSENQDVKKSGCLLPDMTSLKKWIRSENKLGNITLRKYFESNYDPDLEKIVKWTESINEEITLHLKIVPPFPNAVRALEKSSAFADLVIVSQTPLEALEREWENNNLRKYIKIVASQEHGTKTEHLSMAAKGKYPDEKILMIGDAKGDMDAARNNGVLFYPVIPGKEDQSWVKFINEGFIKFINNSYTREYEKGLIEEFIAYLPEKINF